MSLKKSLYHKRILVTCGPTWVPIDNIRVISNTSTGKLGQILAEILAKTGAKVTLLEGPVMQGVKAKSIKVIKFSFFDDFLSQLTYELKKKYDIVIHAAAVADYKLKKPFKGKINSNWSSLKINLISTRKIINLIKRISPRTLLIGFKQEDKLNQKLARLKAKKLFKNAHCDFVIANRVNRKRYEAYIIDERLNILAHVTHRKQLAEKLTQILKEVA